MLDTLPVVRFWLMHFVCNLIAVLNESYMQRFRAQNLQRRIQDEAQNLS